MPGGSVYGSLAPLQAELCCPPWVLVHCSSGATLYNPYPPGQGPRAPHIQGSPRCAKSCCFYQMPRHRLPHPREAWRAGSQFIWDQFPCLDRTFSGFPQTRLHADSPEATFKTPDPKPTWHQLKQNFWAWGPGIGVFKATCMKDWEPLCDLKAGQRWCEWSFGTSRGLSGGQNIETLSPRTWHTRSFSAACFVKNLEGRCGWSFCRGEVKGGNNIFFQRAPMAPASGKTTQKPNSHRTSGISDCAIRRSVRHRSLLASLGRRSLQDKQLEISHCNNRTLSRREMIRIRESLNSHQILVICQALCDIWFHSILMITLHEIIYPHFIVKENNDSTF